MKLTHWYDGCQKPVRPGLFRRKFPEGVRWGVWADGRWGLTCKTKKAALLWAHVVPSSEQCLPWRGIKGPEF